MIIAVGFPERYLTVWPKGASPLEINNYNTAKIILNIPIIALCRMVLCKGDPNSVQNSIMCKCRLFVFQYNSVLDYFYDVTI